MPDIVERSSRLVWCGRLQSAGSVRVHSAGAVQGRARSSSVRVHSAGVGRSSSQGRARIQSAGVVPVALRVHTIVLTQHHLR